MDQQVLLRIIWQVILIILPILGWMWGTNRAFKNYQSILQPEAWAEKMLAKNPLLYDRLPGILKERIESTEEMSSPLAFFVIGASLALGFGQVFWGDVGFFFVFSAVMIASLFWLPTIQMIRRKQKHKKIISGFPTPEELEQRLNHYLDTHQAEILTQALAKDESVFSNKLLHSSSEEERHSAAYAIATYGTKEQVIRFLPQMMADFSVGVRLVAIPHLGKLHTTQRNRALSASFQDMFNINRSVLTRNYWNGAVSTNKLVMFTLFQTELFHASLMMADTDAFFWNNIVNSEHEINAVSASFIVNHLGLIKQYIKSSDYEKLIEVLFLSDSVILHRVALKLMEQVPLESHIRLLPAWVEVWERPLTGFQRRRSHASSSNEFNLEEEIPKAHRQGLVKASRNYLLATFFQEGQPERVYLMKMPPILFCASCLTHSQELTYKKFIIPVCRTCKTMHHLLYDAPNAVIIGVIGGMDQPLITEGNRIYVRMWDETPKKSVYADIHELELRYEAGLSYDWAINAVTQQLINNNRRVKKLTLDPKISLSSNSQAQLKEVVRSS